MVAFRALVRDRRARLSARHAATSLGAFGKVASFDDGKRSHKVDRVKEAAGSGGALFLLSLLLLSPLTLLLLRLTLPPLVRPPNMVLLVLLLRRSTELARRLFNRCTSYCEGG